MGRAASVNESALKIVPSAAGAGPCPAGGSPTQKPLEVRPEPAAPETLAPSRRPEGGGAWGNQGFPYDLAVLLLLLELDELEVVFRDDEARADGADAVRLELVHRVLECLARVVFVLSDVGAGSRARAESHVGLPHRRGIVPEIPRCFLVPGTGTRLEGTRLPRTGPSAWHLDVSRRAPWSGDLGVQIVVAADLLVPPL